MRGPSLRPTPSFEEIRNLVVWEGRSSPRAYALPLSNEQAQTSNSLFGHAGEIQFFTGTVTVRFTIRFVTSRV